MTVFERWLPVVGYEEYYLVSDFGRVMRIKGDGANARAGHVLSQVVQRGYASVALHADGKLKRCRVHRLVLSAFVGQCPRGYEVNHMDGNKSNNHLSNLEYVNHSDNLKHAVRLGLQPLHTGAKNGNSRLTREKVDEIRRLYSLGDSTYESLGRLFGVNPSTISLIVKQRTWK